MKVKITCKTPKGKAKVAMEKQRFQILGYKFTDKLIEEKLVSDSEFYWVLEFDDTKAYHYLVKKCALAETGIRTFYKTLISTIKRINKVGTKFKKGGLWLKKQLIKRLAKKNLDQEQVDTLLDGADLEEQIELYGEKEMVEFLKGEIIVLTIID